MAEGHFKSAESKAKAVANLKGAPKGEARRNNYVRWLESEEDKIERLLAEQPPGERSIREHRIAKMLARQEAMQDRAAAWLGVNPNNPTTAASKRMELVRGTGKAILEHYSALHTAGQERLAAASKPNAGQSVRPVKTEARAIAVAKVIAAAGQAGTSAESRRLGKLLVEQLERDEKDRIAVQTELADLPTTTDREARP